MEKFVRGEIRNQGNQASQAKYDLSVFKINQTNYYTHKINRFFLRRNRTLNVKHSILLPLTVDPYVCNKYIDSMLYINIRNNFIIH